MKLAHIADSHLGIRQYQRQTPTGINQREADVAQAFRTAIDGVIDARPDVVVIAGDLFHSVRPTNAAIVFAFRQLQRLREALPQAPVILIAGNHDTPRSTETGSILRLFEELGVHVATDKARRLEFPDLELSVLAVPHQALVSPDRPPLRPEGNARYRVLVVHGVVEGVLPVDRGAVEYGGALIGVRELNGGEWSYVALGDYHVQFEVAPRVWYAGALEYVSPDFWSDWRVEKQLRHEKKIRAKAKGWLLVDLDTGKVERVGIPTREIEDLETDATGLDAAAVNALIKAQVASVKGGIEGKIVRLKIYNVPRHVARELDHAAIRGYKTSALHFNLDLRRPEVRRSVGVGAPWRRQTLPEMVREYLARRPLPESIDREEFVRLGVGLVEVGESDLVAT